MNGLSNKIWALDHMPVATAVAQKDETGGSKVLKSVLEITKKSVPENNEYYLRTFYDKNTDHPTPLQKKSGNWLFKNWKTMVSLMFYSLFMLFIQFNSFYILFTRRKMHCQGFICWKWSHRA